MANTTHPHKERIYLEGSTPAIQVPFTSLTLSNGEKLLLSTVEGAGTSPLPKVRAPFVKSSAGGRKRTQLECAKAGIITEEMEYAAIRESYAYGDGMAFTPETVLKEIAAGRAVLPCNRMHPECEPMVIGKKFSVKVNANIGASAVSSGYAEEIAKLHLALKHGADTVMDLSTGIDDLMGLRQAMLGASPVPIGTVSRILWSSRAKSSGFMAADSLCMEMVQPMSTPTWSGLT